jgi:hypothetical protein
MSKRLVSLALACTLLLSAAAFLSARAPQAVQGALISHHLFNLPAGVTEAQVIDAIGEMNRGVAASGYANTGYRLWRVSGEQAGDYRYLWVGMWPDQATYDAVHATEAWNQALERAQPVLDRVAAAEVYNRMIEITGGVPGSPRE